MSLVYEVPQITVSPCLPQEENEGANAVSSSFSSIQVDKLRNSLVITGKNEVFVPQFTSAEKKCLYISDFFLQVKQCFVFS